MPLREISAAEGSGGAQAVRYLTLEAARAMECNGCGDCCDSRRTDGYWTWPSLPADGYASETGGQPLIVPLERVVGGWADRSHQQADLGDASGTRFRCTAFIQTPPSEQHPDGGGMCGRHDQWRPPPCHAFPVESPDLDVELAEVGEVPLETGAFPRCTWFRVTVVRPGDPRLSA